MGFNLVVWSYSNLRLWQWVVTHNRFSLFSVASDKREKERERKRDIMSKRERKMNKYINRVDFMGII